MDTNDSSLLQLQGTVELPNSIQNALQLMKRLPPSISGKGGHNAAFAVARALRSLRLRPNEELLAMKLWNETHAHPKWTEKELLHKLASVDSPVTLTHAARSHTARRHGYTKSALDLKLLTSQSLADLFSASQHRNLRSLTPEFVLDILYPGNPLLCLLFNKRTAITAPREEFRGKEGLAEFIVPNAMSKKAGLTKEGRPSQRCLDNTGPRLFLVIESDYSPKQHPRLFEELNARSKGVHDANASLLLHLAEFAPMTMVVHSGNRSLHGWFCVQGVDESRINEFMDYAIALGADPSTRSRCQPVRMPGGLRRSNKRLQFVAYFNEDTLRG